jgi:hypothetical protein
MGKKKHSERKNNALETATEFSCILWPNYTSFVRQKYCFTDRKTSKEILKINQSKIFDYCESLRS